MSGTRAKRPTGGTETKGSSGKEQSSSKVKINGWALLFSDSTILHALAYPADLGDHDPALCGMGCARGWTEPLDGLHEELFRCHSCVVEIEKLNAADLLDRDTRRELKLLNLI